MNALELRKLLKSKKPNFTRQEFGKKKRLKKNWRKPRGIDSKVRLQLRGRKKLVKEGYSSPRDVRFLNPAGLKEVRIENIYDLSKIKEGCIGVISSTVGKRKKVIIIEEAKKLNLTLENGTDSVMQKIKNYLASRKEIKKVKADKKAKVDKIKKEKEAKIKKSEDKKKLETEDKKENSVNKKEKDKLLIKKGSI